MYVPRPFHGVIFSSVVFATVVLLSFATISVYAAPGDLDQTFGVGGIVLTDPNEGGKFTSVALQQDGKIVAVGYKGFDFAILRYHSDGTLDSTFGDNGQVIWDLNTGSSELFRDVAIQPDGKIVAIGESYHNSSYRLFVIARYHPDGSPDNSFGGNGNVITDITARHDYARSIVLQPDGKIIVTGYGSVSATTGSRDFVSVRYLANGDLDTSFGDGGKVKTNIFRSDLAFDSILQPDGKIVVTGTTIPHGLQEDIAMVRYNPDGSLDTSFDGDGIVTTDFDNNSVDQSFSIILLENGNIINLGMSAISGVFKITMVGYNQDGSINSNFGDNGKKIVEFGRNTRSSPALALQSDGKLVVTATVSPSDGSERGEFALARLDFNGNFDSAFGSGGMIFTSISNATHDEVAELTIQPDGNIIVGGRGSQGFALVRYEGDFINQSPTANAGLDQTIDEGDNVVFDGSGSTDPDGVADIASYDWDFGDESVGSGEFANHIYDDDGVFIVTLTVTDSQGDLDTDTTLVTVSNVAPVVTLSGLLSPSEGSTHTYSYVTSDPGDEVFSLVVETCGANGILSNSVFIPATGAGSFDCTFPDGPASSAVSVTVTDGDDPGSDQMIVTVSNVAPVVTLSGLLSPSEGSTHTYSYVTSDPGDEVFSLVVETCGANGILSDSVFIPATGAGSFDCTFPDGPVSSLVSVTVSDDDDPGSNGMMIAVANLPPTITSITVPLTPVDLADQASFTVDVHYTDPAGLLDTPFICDFDMDNDGFTDTSVSSNDLNCSAALAYSEPGVYTVKVTVTDTDGGNDMATATDFIVIYDPEGGFVTGGGWIWSGPGWCFLDAVCGEAEGKANFGFVSKYQKGAFTPSGSTEFNFSAGDLNFHSSVYAWLVINQGGTNAQYKGEGTINGQLAPNGEAYKFMIWAKDQDFSLGDSFRIKIWWQDANGNEILVYDNGFDQPIGGGNIKIHDGN
jgi:uncharacterized delta-60 repeat protein